ncbi:hypothetical protein CK203_025636 [Vitis vinifera]|uniref:Uncharacterized protein n=1 Tax=Vitis vinifera TaxID=29760 RepID=A0A438IE82_VITVI|nr:hypothetical protein CK203_025636 [Vitis vinifera]
MEAAFLVWVVHCIQLFPSLTIFAYLNWLDGACPSVHVCLVRGGGRGGYGGGDRRRDNYRDNAGSGPDRHHHGGNRSRPY